MVVARCFSNAPQPRGLHVDDLLAQVAEGGALRFDTPWQAGGLGLGDLAAHRVYLRQLADALADHLADALGRDGRPMGVAVPSA